jgi:hypothetical protein
MELAGTAVEIAHGASNGVSTGEKASGLAISTNACTRSSLKTAGAAVFAR